MTTSSFTAISLSCANLSWYFFWLSCWFRALPWTFGRSKPRCVLIFLPISNSKRQWPVIEWGSICIFLKIYTIFLWHFPDGFRPRLTWKFTLLSRLTNLKMGDMVIWRMPMAYMNFVNSALVQVGPLSVTMKLGSPMTEKMSHISTMVWLAVMFGMTLTYNHFELASIKIKYILLMNGPSI